MLTLFRDITRKDKPVTDQSHVNKVQGFETDPVLFEYCRRPEILKFVKAFTGPDVLSVHTMLINKPPDEGERSSRHPLHQDLHYFPFRPADRVVASWTAMERVNRANGCLVVIPVSLKRGCDAEIAIANWRQANHMSFAGLPS